MKRLSIAAALVVTGTGAALADPCIVTFDATNPTYSPDDTAITLLFDAFGAVVGNPGTCAPTFAAHSNLPNDPNLFEVYSADYRGDILPSLDDQGEITVEANGRTSTGTFTSGDNPVFTHFIGKEADGTLSSDITVRISNATDPATEAFIDSVDYLRAGTMTRADAEASLAELGSGQASLVTHLDATSWLLGGGTMGLEGPDEVRVLGGVGSYMLGGNARFNLSDGFSLLAGVSLVDQTAGGAGYTGALGKVGLRFVEQAPATARLFGEVGVDVAALNMRFSRTYTSSTGTQTVTGAGNGGLGALYLTGGMLFELDSSNQIALSATAKQSMLGFGDYRETVSAGNLFAADLSNQMAGFTTLKVGADWTAELTEELSLTAHVGLGTTIANQATSAYILGGGTTTGASASTVFAEYGLGLGYEVMPGSTIEAFVQGSTGTNIGTHAQVGAAFRMAF